MTRVAVAMTIDSSGVSFADRHSPQVARFVRECNVSRQKNKLIVAFEIISARIATPTSFPISHRRSPLRSIPFAPPREFRGDCGNNFANADDAGNIGIDASRPSIELFVTDERAKKKSARRCGAEE